jgi:osmotically-inducible protein OsmY
MLGVGTGLAMGLFLGEWLGWERLRRRPDTPTPAPAGAAHTIAQTVKAVRKAFDQDEAFHTLEITVRALAPGTVEVSGWVDDRATRAQVIRFAQAVPGIPEVLPSLLVRGEDDIHLRDHRSSANPRS